MLKRGYLHSAVLALLLIFSFWFISDATRVEYLYARGSYQYTSRLLRSIFGSLPFSFGDLMYGACLLLLIIVFVQALAAFFRSTDKWSAIGVGLIRTMKAAAWIWIVFHGIWGFNYYRTGIEVQFQLQDEEPSREALICFTEELLTEVNKYAPGRVKDLSSYSVRAITVDAYHQLQKTVPGLVYTSPSFKASLFGVLGNYMGYGGYYNPLSGEAQLNDKMPGFMLPFIGVHEVAHQLGYARESEANFIGYLASLHASDSSLRYSANLEMFLYANGAVRKFDSLLSKQYQQQLSPIAQHDFAEYRSFAKKYYGPLDNLTTWFYAGFLKFNNQPDGMGSYNRGMVYVLKYMKKAGKSRP